MYDWKSKLSNLFVFVKSLYFFNENMKISFVRFCFLRDREFYGFLKIIKVIWGRGYYFFVDVMNGFNLNFVISLGLFYSSRCRD